MLTLNLGPRGLCVGCVRLPPRHAWDSATDLRIHATCRGGPLCHLSEALLQRLVAAAGSCCACRKPLLQAEVALKLSRSVCTKRAELRLLTNLLQLDASTADWEVFCCFHLLSPLPDPFELEGSVAMPLTS